MNLNSLDKDKHEYRPYADEPGAQGTDKPSCSDYIMLVLLCILATAFMLACLALAAPIG